MEQRYDIIDKRFGAFIAGEARLERLFEGTRWMEGPVWFADGRHLLFSDIPNDRMLRWTENGETGIFRAPAGYSNGNTRDREGRLVTCEHGNRRVTRTETDGSVTVLADSYRGKRLNSPNDVVVKSDGTVWFTDPDYGIISDYEGYKSESELGKNFVFRLDPRDGSLEIVADDFHKPNGIAFTPDENHLLIADSGDGKHIRKFAVGSGNRLSGGEVFTAVDGGPDGFRFDTGGNLWASGSGGVHCYSREGELLGRILVPEPAANVEFGGPKRNRLFITATTSLYSIYLTVNGARRP